MRFVKNWDILLKEQIKLLPKKSCLSNYVSTYDINTNEVINQPLRGPMFLENVNSKDNFYSWW